MENYLRELTLPSRESHLEIWGMTDDLYLRALYAIMYKEKPNHTVELGTYRGFSTNAMAQGLIDSLPHTIMRDLFTIDLHEDYDYKTPEAYKPLVTVIKGNTQDNLLPSKLRPAWIDVKEWIDILFVDADHSYENTAADWNTWKDYVKPGGLVMFHDIRPLHDHTRGSAQHWEEMKAANPGRWSEMPGCEMGVIRLP